MGFVMDADPTSGNLVGHAAKEKEQFGWAIRVLRLNCRISVFLLYALFPLKSNSKTGKVEVAILALTSSQPPWPPVYDFKAKHIFADVHLLTNSKYNKRLWESKIQVV
ncbi:hypothetical protein SDJN03_11108, partial [Cucurbita argyrosperma subsp. sororia]